MSIFLFVSQPSIVTWVLLVLEWIAPKIWSFFEINETEFISSFPELKPLNVQQNWVVPDFIHNSNVLIILNDKISYQIILRKYRVYIQCMFWK